MATDLVHKQEFRIRDLGTRSVVLFPSRAQIIRDIKDITLQPGPNEIIIDGLAPTVDEHSIKVEGTGTATISGVTVDLLPNRESYEDVYPSDTEDEDDDESEHSDEEPEAMQKVNEQIKALNDKIRGHEETSKSAADRLSICDSFGKSLEKEPTPAAELEKIVRAYKTEREKIFLDHAASVDAMAAIEKQMKKVLTERRKIAKALVKAKEKQEKEKAKARAQKQRRKAEILKEKERIKAERDSFWPKKVYRVTIHLEPSLLTPGSSRRGSVDSETTVNLATTTFHQPTDTKPGTVSLSLSYITYSASWSPRYDLSLNTVKCIGVLEYGAELFNTTSETWRDAKVILSTSQTTFSGLSETIPTLQPWHVRLMKGGRNGGLFSQDEVNAKNKEWNTSSENTQKPRYILFGVDNTAQNALVASQEQQRQAVKNERKQKVSQVLASQLAPQTSSLFGSSIPGRRMALKSMSAGPAPAFGGGMAARKQLGYQHLDEDKEEDEDEDMGFGLMDEGIGSHFGAPPLGMTSMPAPNSLVFEEGAWEETGMTTTYDVPGFKTIAPSNSNIKHKIAKIEFRNIVFSHIVIGKLRQVAFLKARMRNASKINLLKGPLGLTLDGSFLGSATFPRCSPNESFSLPLGVDPSISIAYLKPTVKRSQSGIFQKEDTNVFTRTIIITNTKHNAPAEITVLDQVPISEDERLRIEIVSPKGLKAGGDSLRTGQSSHEAQLATLSKASTNNSAVARASVYGGNGKEVAPAGNWGSAVAQAKKGGEVSWSVKLNPGQGVKLCLEYEATFPGGETVVGVQGKNGADF